jgi:F0F1-type ATP synthase delta subunit
MKISSNLRSIIKKKVMESIKSPEAREVIVRTPFKLTDDEISTMKAQFPKLHSAQLVNEIDSSLIGGVVIVDGSMILDYSIKGKMNELVDSLLEN